MKKFKEGDEVCSNPKSSNYNQFKGLIGIITKLNDYRFELPYSVRWNNGYCSYCNLTDLELYSNEPTYEIY